MHNPYSFWSAFGSQDGSSSSGQQPSVFGALPTASSTQTSGLLSFVFTSFNPNILNCTVVGPNNQPHFYLTTDSTLPGYTVMKMSDGRSFGLVEWKEHPQVEIRSTLHKQLVSRFLSLSPDQRYRIMNFGGQQYMWVPQQSAICLYTGDGSSTLLAKLSKERGNIILEISPTAIRAGLLHPCITAVMLLQSGRRID